MGKEMPIARRRNEGRDNPDEGEFWRVSNIIHVLETRCTGFPDARFLAMNRKTGRFSRFRALGGIFQHRDGCQFQWRQCDRPARPSRLLELRGLEFRENGKRPA